MRRRHKFLLIVLITPIVVVTMAVVILTQTDWGRERVRRLALSALEDAVVGEIRIGAVEGNLLRGVTLRDISIVDTLGQPFLSADAISARFGRRALIGRRIELTGVHLLRPVIVLDRQPGADEWNFQRIFPGEPDDPVAEGTVGWGSWIRLRDVEIEHGRVVIRMPWAPENYMSEAARQQAIEGALAGEGRTRVVPAPGGYQQVMDFHAVNARLPLVLVADPDAEAMEIDVASLQTIAEPFLPPAADIRDLRGTFFVAEDSLYFRGVELTMPRTHVLGSGTYLTDNGDLALRLSGDRVALADMRWLYPRLPADGGGPLDLTVHMRGDVTEVHSETTGLRIGEARVNGRFGMLMATDSLQLHRTDLTFAQLDTRLLEQMIPDLELPRRGVLGGRARLHGPLSGIDVDADVTFDDTEAGRSRVTARGEAGMIDGAFRARELRLGFAPLQVDLARVAMEDLPVSGVVTGSAVLTGSTATRLVATMDIRHEDRGAVSVLAGRGGVEFVGPQQVELDLRVQPLSLVTVGRFVPAAQLHGAARGTVRMTGSLGDADVTVDLRLPAGGALMARARLDLNDGDPGYDFTAGLRVVDLATITELAPPSMLSATFTGRGRGIDPETMRAAFGVSVDRSVIDGVVFEEAEGRIAIEEGLLTLDTLVVGTDFAQVEAGGTFGLVPEREGELRYALAVDSLGGFQRWMPPADTGQVEPSPRARQRAMAEARREWIRLVQAAEVERVATGAAERRPVTMRAVEREIARDTIGGQIAASGVASGNIEQFAIRGNATAYEVIAFGHALGFGRVEYAVTDLPARAARIVVGATLDSVRTAGFAFDTVHVRATLVERDGDVHLAILQDADIEYVTQASFELRPEENLVRVDDLRMRFDTTVWVAQRPAAFRWGPQGMSVDSLDLRSGVDGRLYVNGRLPTEEDVDLEIDVHRFELEHAVALLQREPGASGVITATARMTGSAANPHLRGAAGLVNGSLMQRHIPDIRAAFRYADQTLVAEAEAHDQLGRRLAVADARVPLNLALTDEPGPRMPARPLEVDIRADSLPLDALPSLTDAVADVQGQLDGEVSIRGTFEEPVVNGDLFVSLGSFMIVTTGVRLQDIVGSIRVRGDTVVIDSLVGWARGPIRIRGGLGLATLTEPSFDLRLDAENALVLDTEEGEFRADADLRMTGPWERALITGSVNVRSGVYRLAEDDFGEVIDLTDPELLARIDPHLLADQAEVIPEEFLLLDNLRMELSVSVQRDTWIRSPEANIEIFSVGDLTLELDRGEDRLEVEGVVNTDRGEYTFLGRRFLVSRGSVTFIGGEEINPLLQIVAEHEIRGRDPFEIQVVIGGTLNEPQVTLESNAQPPISQSDLLTYIAFQRQVGSVLQLQGAGLAGGGGGQVGGRVIGLATQQMAAVAMGVLVSELERTAGQTLGAEIINITPGDVPDELARGGSFREIRRGIEVEVGRYVDTRTFVAVQTRLYAGSPGIRVTHRLPRGYRIDSSFEPRFETRQPTLGDPPSARTFNIFGLFFSREWRF